MQGASYGVPASASPDESIAPEREIVTLSDEARRYRLGPMAAPRPRQIKVLGDFLTGG
jgi:hypothetical protein